MKRGIRSSPYLLLLPALVLYLFFIIPLVIMVETSFKVFSNGIVVDRFTVSNYAQFFSESFFRTALFQTLYLGLTVTVSALILGYPVAYVLARTKSNLARSVISSVVILPLFVSLIARSFGWIVVLSQRGLINYVLQSLGLIKQPLVLIFNFFGVYVSMTHIVLPFMVFSIAASVTSIDENLLLSARSLGASPFQVFRRVVLPLSLPGLLAGSIIVFVLTISAYITPELLGAGLVPSLPVTVYEYAIDYLNTPLASAIAVILLIITMAFVGVYVRLLRQERLYGEETHA